MGIILVGMILTLIAGFILGVIVMSDGNHYNGGR